MRRNALLARKRLSVLIAVMIVVQSIAACSSGGGGDAPPSFAPVSYTGLTSPAVITEANANQLFAAVWGMRRSRFPQWAAFSNLIRPVLRGARVLRDA